MHRLSYIERSLNTSRNVIQTDLGQRNPAPLIDIGYSYQCRLITQATFVPPRQSWELSHFQTLIRILRKAWDLQSVPYVASGFVGGQDLIIEHLTDQLYMYLFTFQFHSYIQLW